MWGCELKKRSSPRRSVKCRHPPCEDVSWKGSKLVGKLKGISHPPCEDVSWKEGTPKTSWSGVSHPPCEDVSWKNGAVLRVAQVEESSSMWGCELKREWCKNVWYSSIALFMRKIVPSNDMNSIYVMRKRGELKEYKLQFLSIKKGLYYLGEVQPWGKSYEKDLKCLFSWTIPSIELNCDKTVMELGRNC